MRPILLITVFAAFASAATRNVCLSGCAYSSWQAAVTDAQPGDTIVGKAGENLGSITLRGGARDLTFKSSAIDSWPRGYRIGRNSSLLARATQVTIGDDKMWTRPVAADTLANVIGGNSTYEVAHGLKPGDRVVMGAGLFGMLHCAVPNQAPYGAICDAARTGYLSIRTNTGLTDGMTVFFQARPSVPLPPPLQLETPYYIRDFTAGGANAAQMINNPPKFRVAATPGGAPVNIAQFDPAGRDFNLEIPPHPARRGDVLFVVDVPDAAAPAYTNGKRLKLSFTPDGPPIVWQQTPYGYDGGGYSIGVSVTKFRRVENITFDGLEVLPVADTDTFYVFHMVNGFGPENMEAETTGIRILRCWIHGRDDQETFPHSSVRFGARDIEIGWSVIEGAYSTGNDTQGIGANSSTGGINVHDNLIKGATQGFFSGGGFPDYAPNGNMNGLRLTRNYFAGDMRGYHNLSAKYVSGTQFALSAALNLVGCDTVAANNALGNRCFWYEGDDEIPASSNITRYEFAGSIASNTFTVTGSIAGQKGYVYGLAGALYMRHNFGGTVTCPASTTCIPDAAPAFPAGSTRIGIAILGTGNVFQSGSFYQEFRPPFLKARIESKGVDNALVEGNVLQRQGNCDGGSACQNNLIQWTIGGNGSGAGQPMHYAVSSSNAIFRNNIFRSAASAITFNGKTFNFAYPENGAYTCNECNGFGNTISNRVENNLFYDIGSTEYTFGNNPALGTSNGPAHTVIQNNTLADVYWGINCAGCRYFNWSNNVFTPYRSSCGGSADCPNRSATTHPGVLHATGSSIYFPKFSGEGAYANASGVAAANSTFRNNLIMNRPGFWYTTNVPLHYPSPTYLVQHTESGRDPAVLFTKWVERVDTAQPDGKHYLGANFRLAAGKCGAYPGTTSRCIGADIDEIEALTGPMGDDVVRGIPQFSERSARRIDAGTTTATISFLPNGSSCTIKIWNNPNYSGNPVVDATDSGAAAVAGRLYVNLTGLTANTNYSGKRWCGQAVDVFSFTTAKTAVSTGTVTFGGLAAGATDCFAEYGLTPALGTATAAAPVTEGRCSVSVPNGNYFRHVYTAGGIATGRSEITLRGQ